MTPVELNEFEGVYSREWQIVHSIYQDYLSGVKKQAWSVIKTHRLAKILKDYAKTGIIRDEEGVIEVAEEIIQKTAALYVNTILCGHTSIDPVPYLEEELDEKIDTEKFEAFTDEYLFDDEVGQYRISDYGLGKLMDICYEMEECKTAIELLSCISMALNVMHQRSNLSAWLIEGGIQRLKELSNLDVHAICPPYQSSAYN